MRRHWAKSAGGIAEERAIGKKIRAGAVEKLGDGIVRRGCAGEDHVIRDPRGVKCPGGENLVRLFCREIGKHRVRVGGIDDAEDAGSVTRKSPACFCDSSD